MMTGLTPQDLLEFLNKMDPSQFELLVGDLAKHEYPTAEVKAHLRIGAVQADVVVDTGATLVVIEAKRVQLVNGDLLRSQIVRRGMLQAQHPSLQYVLAVSGQLTDAARFVATKYELMIWDGPHVVARLTPELRQKWFGIFADHSVQVEQPAAVESIVDALSAIKPGNVDALIYQKWVADVFEYLFVPPLGPVHYEDSDGDRRNRRDLILENWAIDGFWAQVRSAYGADQVVVDAKNHSGFLKKRPVLDLSHYLKPYGCGMFGVICCRKGAGPTGMHAIREQWIGGGRMILPLSDTLLVEMLRLKASGTPPEEILRRQVANFRKSL